MAITIIICITAIIITLILCTMGLHTTHSHLSASPQEPTYSLDDMEQIAALTNPTDRTQEDNPSPSLDEVIRKVNEAIEVI